MNYYVILIVVSLFFLSLTTRALPFLFAAKLSGNARMQAVGRRLTSYIMMLLVIYEVNPVSFTTYPYAMPAMLSLLLVIVVHLLFHKPLLSMILGTTSFILLGLIT
jgi:branched-subunit amino acid transport protein AzlD